MYQLVYVGDVEVLGTTTNRTIGQCLDGTLSPELVKGKIILCLSGYSYSVEKGLEVKRVQGIGFILQNPMNGLESNILKPNINTAPGLNILAAWSEASSPTKLPDDHRVVKYNIDSRTSMSCPHVAAIAALIKAIHPDWSSAIIRFALITTGILACFNSLHVIYFLAFKTSFIS
ncbi:hypothetical protein TEA_012070 [Camellia sinensis var. sinensis]|uniref:Peptidase S8/S53 domain-containing protein n=1 Tax=Camellia sinensis var. sinensis TaxID=542762 RepID=A0A4S4DIM5_CAMSN|nr:hypothetical protein TEA_012070 [Camellia sinensis var. sinensis]